MHENGQSYEALSYEAGLEGQVSHCFLLHGSENNSNNKSEKSHETI